MDARTCKSCNESFPLSNFRLRKYSNGKTHRLWKCKSCYADNKKSRREEIRQWFVEYKQTLACADCGVADHRVLEFHHRDKSTKEGKISDWVTKGIKSKENILVEIAKCDVLCANCHRILHYEERNN